MRAKTYCIFFLLHCIIWTAWASPLTNSRHIGISDGLPTGQVFDIKQDACGYLWMATINGLCRYDGYQFLSFDIPQASAGGRKAAVGYVIPDDDGRHLWLQTTTYTYACYDMKENRFADFANGKDATRVYKKFYQDKNGVLWMRGSETGVRRVKASRDGSFDCTDYDVAHHTLPHNQVNDMVTDNKGNAWVLTKSGLVLIKADKQAKILDTSCNYYIGISTGDRVMVVNERREMITYDTNGKQLRRMLIPAEIGRLDVSTACFLWQGRWIIMTQEETYVAENNGNGIKRTERWHVPNGSLISNIDGNHFVSNATGTLWLFPAHGEMRRFDLMDGLSMASDRYRRYSIARGQDGLYYIANYGNGLFVYDPQTHHFDHYSAADQWPLINSNYLNSILIDQSGCIWLGENSNGITYIMPNGQLQADYYLPRPNRKGDWSNHVRLVKEDVDGSLVLSTHDNKLYRMQITDGSFQQIQQTPATVYGWLTDSKGHRWVGTRGYGLFRDGQPMPLPAKHIYTIAEDALGRIWVATWDMGLFVIEPTPTFEYTNLMNRSQNEHNIRDIKIDKNGLLWAATCNGVYTIDTRRKSLSDHQLQCYNTQNHELPFDEIICLLPMGNGTFYVGGRGGGIVKCRLAQGHVVTDLTYSAHEGLSSNNVFSLVEDTHGNIWAGTDNGLTCIRHDGKVSSYLFGHLPQSNVYSENSAALLPNGDLLMGTGYGLMKLHDAGMNRYEPHKPDTLVVRAPKITEVIVGDSCIIPSAERPMLTLRHHENNIRICFSTLDYAGMRFTQYQYYMEGADKSWQPLTSNHQANYNKMSPGHYRFHLKALNQDSQWSEVTIFDITIRQPWYNTWWAWLVWMAAIAMLAWYLLHLWRHNFELKQQIKMRQEQTNFRLRLFTHIIHEFRTPLAIISGATDKLSKSTTDGRCSQTAVQSIRRGTKRLMKQVDQLMEFRKLNSGNVKLNVRQVDIVALTRNVIQEFRDMAEQKDISMTLTPFAKSHIAVVDPYLVETILYNLLSNAVKYTPRKGTVTTCLRLEGQQITITVEDSGPGIDKEQEKQLFQPYMHGYVSQGGMGIGLYTAYYTALYHHGSLTYRRKSEEGGSLFTLTLPADESSYTANDYATTTAISQTADEGGSTVNRKGLQGEAFNDINVAIIEDDSDMLQQTCENIGLYFRVTPYADGHSALEGIARQPPQLIICDVMLPDINGYDIARQLRSQKPTSNIPIIMLTALDDEEQLIEGYKAGADDYLVKPCNFERLILRITQLVKWYSKMNPATEHTIAQRPIITDEADQRFRQKVETIVSRRMGEPDFTVDVLASQLKMGRTKFYGKMKELTGMSPNNYLQTERLKRAAELLEEGELNISEISYKVGFQSSAYFYKCFKEKYGIPPSKYGKE